MDGVVNNWNKHENEPWEQLLRRPFFHSSTSTYRSLFSTHHQSHPVGARDPSAHHDLPRRFSLGRGLHLVAQLNAAVNGLVGGSRAGRVEYEFGKVRIKETYRLGFSVFYSSSLKSSILMRSASASTFSTLCSSRPNSILVTALTLSNTRQHSYRSDVVRMPFDFIGQLQELFVHFFSVPRLPHREFGAREHQASNEAADDGRGLQAIMIMHENREKEKKECLRSRDS